MLTQKHPIEQVGDDLFGGLLPPRPSPLPVRPDGIPSFLKETPKWVCWRYELPERRTKWTKRLKTTRGGNASTADPATWTTFDRAAGAYTAGGFDGIGIVFDGVPVDVRGLVLAGVDLDHVTDTQAGRDRANRILSEFKSYAEWSPGGTGVHIYCLALPLGAGVNRDGVELYTSGRFFTVTGHAVEAGDA